jgi:hypothetical protein
VRREGKGGPLVGSAGGRENGRRALGREKGQRGGAREEGAAWRRSGGSGAAVSGREGEGAEHHMGREEPRRWA